MAAPGPALALDPETRRHLTSTLSAFGRLTRERGMAYAHSGRVRGITIDDGEIRATVNGTTPYQVSLLREVDDDPRGDGFVWEHDCTCPVGVWCKHTYALLLVLLGTRQPQVGNAATIATAGGPRRDYFPQSPASIAVERAKAEAAALRRVRSAPSMWERESGAASLLARASLIAGDQAAILREAHLADEDPDLRCWHLARAIALRDPAGPPAVLESFRDRPDLAQRFAERERTALRRDLELLAGWGRFGRPRTLRCVVDLQRRADGTAKLAVEIRVTTAKVSDAPRSIAQLRHLRTEVGSDPSLLPPDQTALLALFLDHDGIGNGEARDVVLSAVAMRLFLEQAARASLASWRDSLDPALAQRCGIVAGAPVVFAHEPAQLVPWCTTRAGVTSLELRFLFAGGRTVMLGDAAYVRSSDVLRGTMLGMVVAAGAIAVVAAEPPPRLVERFAAVGALELSRDERVGLLEQLAPRWPHLRTIIERHTRLLPITPIATLDLRSDDWLQIRLFARTAVPARGAAGSAGLTEMFEHVPQTGWCPAPPAVLDLVAIADERVPAADDGPGAANPVSAAQAAVVEPAGDEIWREVPDLARAAPLDEWRATTGAQAGDRRVPGQSGEPPWPDRDVGFWLRLSPRRLEQLFAAWQRRPRGATYLGNDRARKLFGGTTRVTPKLRVAASGVDFLAVSAEWRAEGAWLSEEDVAALRSATTRFVKLEAGWVQRDESGLGAVESALADLGVEAGAGEQRLTIWQLAGTPPESLAALEQLGADPETLRAVRTLRERIAGFRGLPRVAVPRTLTAKLRPYQRDGLDFLCFTGTLGTGAILADDMGLGKTVQTLAWLEHLRRLEPDGGPSLVVCPASVVHNWQREAARFTPKMRVLVLERGGDRHLLHREIGDYDLVLTNYALLRRDADAWQATELRAAILDEAQNVKNPDAVVTRAALALNARHRLALTGTPLENRPLDLWSIASFVCPGYLGTRKDFTGRFDHPELPPERRRLLAARLRPILLRRLKTEVARDLPDRIEERLDCDLTAGQRKLYLAELTRSRKLVEQLASEPDGLRRNRITILAALTRLRQICCHPALVGGKAELGSGKLAALLELLEPLLAEGHKVLLFSQFVACLKILAHELAARDIAHHMLTGETVARERVLQAFADDPRPGVFLLSLKAGGTGLNLTSASYVVLFDPWWNPAVEAQAIDRSHRIGQDRTVIAYRLVARGTIEEKIAELQERKASLVRDVLGDGTPSRALSRDDLGFLLSSDP